MSRRTQVIIQTEPETPYDWRRFVAILCFIEFFWQFVAAGQDMAEEWSRRHVDQTAEAQLCMAVSLMIRMARACAFYAYGRSLWYSRGPTIWHLFTVITLSALTIAAPTVECLVGQGYVWFQLPHSEDQIKLANPWSIAALLALDQLPWLAVLRTGMWCVPRSRNRSRWRSQPWVWIAVAWCAGTIPVMAMHHFPYDWGITGWLSTFSIAPYLWCGLPALAVVFLLSHRREARTFAICTAMVTAVPAAWFLYHWNRLTYAAVLCLWCAVPRKVADVVPEPSSWTYLLLYRQSFRWFIIDMVARIGPWLLIAIYAWRMPMVTPPDDGSPFPRAFCGRCRYNLHGLDHPDQCPECGSPLDWAKVRASASASRASDLRASSGVDPDRLIPNEPHPEPQRDSTRHQGSHISNREAVP